MTKQPSTPTARFEVLSARKGRPFAYRILWGDQQMPIPASEQQKYGLDWQETRERVLDRASYRCEECDVENHAWGWRDHEHVFHPEDLAKEMAKLKGRGHRRATVFIATEQGLMKIIQIVLTVSHQDHDPSHNDLGNLKALCQQCHLRYDRELHRKHRMAHR